VLLLIATSGDFKVTADELWGLATDTLENAELATVAGKNIRALRAELSLSLRDLEALSGIAAPNLHTLESGKTWPRLDTLGRVAFGSVIAEFRPTGFGSAHTLARQRLALEPDAISFDFAVDPVVRPIGPRVDCIQPPSVSGRLQRAGGEDVVAMS
jgi:transcriptional regulator with XRE-family HTH domain